MKEILSWETKVSVVGENYNDKSYPHIFLTFLTVKLENFDKLPEAIQVEAQKIIDDEIETKKKSITDLQKSIDVLLAKGASLLELKKTLAN